MKKPSRPFTRLGDSAKDLDDQAVAGGLVAATNSCFHGTIRSNISEFASARVQDRLPRAGSRGAALHHGVEGQPSVGSSVGWFPGELRQLRQIGNSGLVARWGHWCTVDEVHGNGEESDFIPGKRNEARRGLA